LVEGSPFAVLADREKTPWPKTPESAADYKFHGYKLDTLRRPTFRYDFRDIAIEDFPADEREDGEAALVRSLTLKQNPNAKPNATTIYFRAAVGDKIEPQTDGSFQVDGRMTLRFATSSGEKPFVRRLDLSELLAPVAFEKEKATVNVTYSW
jgi:hypothetical protein